MKTVSHIIILLILTSCSLDKRQIVPAKYNGKYGAINSKGKWIIEPTFDSLSNFYNGFADTYKNGKWGYINLHGDLKIDTLFSLAYEFKNGLAEVEIETTDTTAVNKN